MPCLIDPGLLQVSETGWGEFEVQIKIHFQDASERPVNLYHMLKLFHTTGADSNTTTAMVQGRKTVVSESYDEIIFHEPTQVVHLLVAFTAVFRAGHHLAP